MFSLEAAEQRADLLREVARSLLEGKRKTVINHYFNSYHPEPNT